MEADFTANFTRPIILAYDTDPANTSGKFAEYLAESTNVTIVSIDEFKANYTTAPYIVLIGNPAPVNNTVGGLIYEIMNDTGTELAELMKNDSNHIAVRRGVWTNTQTVVMLAQAYFLDVGRVINHLKDKNVTISQDSCIIEYQTAPIIHNVTEFLYGVKTDEIDTIKATDSAVVIVLSNWTLPTIQLNKYDIKTTPSWLLYRTGLKFGQRATNKYLNVEVKANGSTLGEFQEAWIILYYREADLDLNGDGNARGPWDISESKLSVYFYNESIGAWIRLSKELDWVLEIGINTTDLELYGESYAGYVWIRVTHLSFFTLGGYQNIPFWDYMVCAFFFAVGIAIAAAIIVAYRRQPTMDNIAYEVKDKKLLLKFNTTKDYGKSTSGKTIIVANSHGTKRIKGTEFLLGMIAYKYPEKKEISPKKRPEMQNIEVRVKGKNVTLTIDLEQEYGHSHTGKSIIIASSRGNRPIEDTGVIVGVNIFKKQKKAPKGDRKPKKPPEKKHTTEKPEKREIKSPAKKGVSKHDEVKPVDIAKPKESKPTREQVQLALDDIPGIGPIKIDLLKKAGILTLEDLINCDPKTVTAQVAGIGIKSLNKWIQSAKELTST